MRIAIDYQSAFGLRTGVGSATASLVSALKAESPETEFLLYGHDSGRDLDTLSRLRWENVDIPRLLARDKPDLFYAPGFAGPLFTSLPKVITVHDVIGLAYPSNQRSFSRFYWSFWLPRVIRKADKIVVPSEHTRKDLERFLSIPKSRVDVAAWGADSAFRVMDDRGACLSVLGKYRIREPFLISVSSLEPRKNHLRLLQAYQRLGQEGRGNFSLVIVGKDAGCQQELLKFIGSNGLGERVHLLGYVPQEELISLYNAAMGYVMISLYEGFGLPVLEAMRCGISGVISDRTSLPEVAGDSAVTTDPESIPMIADSLSRYAWDANLRRDLSARALQRSKEFSYERAAKKMMEVFRNELGKK